MKMLKLLLLTLSLPLLSGCITITMSEWANRTTTGWPRMLGALDDADGVPLKLIFRYGDSQVYAVVPTREDGSPLPEQIEYRSGPQPQIDSPSFKPAINLPCGGGGTSSADGLTTTITYELEANGSPRELDTPAASDPASTQTTTTDPPAKSDIPPRPPFAVMLCSTRPRPTAERVRAGALAVAATPVTATVDIVSFSALVAIAPVLMVLDLTGVFPRY